MLKRNIKKAYRVKYDDCYVDTFIFYNVWWNYGSYLLLEEAIRLPIYTSLCVCSQFSLWNIRVVISKYNK